MPNIEVNHQTLRSTATTVRQYCAVQQQEMRKADSAVRQMLSCGWTGSDADTFREKWEGINVSGSLTYTVKESLENCADGLDETAKLYEKAQADAYTLAYYLMKLW